MYRPERTSALSMIQTNHRETRSPTIRKRPCIFCSRDHWDSDCDIYSTVKGRMKRLKILKKCTICLKDSHQGETCKAKKRCFYCKASHNSALCEKRSTPTLNITTLPKKQQSIYPDKKESPVLLYHSTGEPQTNKAKDILLLCKGIGVFNPEYPQKQRRALALFDIGSQLSFISKKLSSQLQLAESDHRNMLVAPFGTKEPLQCPTANAQLSICTVDNEIITINTHVIEYLTQEIQVVDIPVKEQCEDLTSHWDKPDILIGADCFFKFVDSQDKKELRSGCIMVHSKVGPTITGEGYIDELCNSKGHSVPIICSVYTNPNSELEKFWRLEMIGIHESPTEDDDERAIDHFNKTIIKLDGRYRYVGRGKTLNKGLVTITVMYRTLEEFEEVPPNDEVGVVHYLPHHEVLTPHKNTTQIRIVYDASAHQRGFKSLNELLYRGPVILPDLVGVLLRFRAMKIVITADIEKAFLQIGLQEEERNCTRFLWVKDTNQEVNNENMKCYRFKRVPFGVISSPFLLTATLNYHLGNSGSTLAKEIRQNLYVYNVTISANNTEEAFWKYEEMKVISQEASITLENFSPATKGLMKEYLIVI
uniref:DUF1758 domain-containing protein n=1 Tax=Loa loa TaxID=7209 RepID=A0A1I7VG88_LOALO